MPDWLMTILVLAFGYDVVPVDKQAELRRKSRLENEVFGALLSLHPSSNPRVNSPAGHVSQKVRVERSWP